MKPEEKKRSQLATKLMNILVILVLLRLTAYVVDNFDSAEKGFNKGRAAASK
jgi:hypothetical protein